MKAGFFARNLSKYLKNSGLSHGELARLSGLSRPLITNYAKGSSDPSVTNALIIAQALGVPLTTLTGEEKVETKRLIEPSIETMRKKVYQDDLKVRKELEEIKGAMALMEEFKTALAELKEQQALNTSNIDTLWEWNEKHDSYFDEVQSAISHPLGW